ncbi:hypothetical protein P153DRAFT_428554 [Dothidotthia symphoricarpi CBS 119687]|uniref:Uncharacterized protein n=1 Tax=Dothidotthia symphoricarpi CBS 119687 TaxID=1392245 RepID=A0A6A6ASU4_9PLEO|nr:uncharacterized protein P153DRAFT_428554 [Dothidotthia symphoricarpi CBS 119687]KAF2133621.1 hypothetical protein P153DRAFT_428554 [Dothidotthia symphoricarpi CBS 119687]
MVIGHTKTPSHDRLPARQPSITTLFRSDRRRGCQLRELPTSYPTNSYQQTCPEQRDFAPTPNRFSLLAELKHSPTKPKWEFDFVPTTVEGTRRRGKRGGKHTKSKGDAPKKKDERGTRALNLDELCNRMAALRLNNEKPIPTPRLQTGDDQHSAVKNSSINSAESAKTHWAPQFKPNELRTPAITTPKPTNMKQTDLPKQSERRHAHHRFSRSPSEVWDYKRKEARSFPFSAFPASADLTSRDNPLPQISRLALAQVEFANKQPSICTLPPTQSQQSAVLAACRVLATRKSGLAPSPLNDEPVKHQADLQSSSPSTANIPTYIASSTLAGTPTIPNHIPTMPSPSVISVPLPISTLVPIVSVPPTPSVQGPQSLQSPCPRPLLPTCSPRMWTDVSEGITVFKPSLRSPSTTPAVPLYPSTNAPKPRLTPVVPLDPFKQSPVTSFLARPKPPIHFPSPEVQKELDDFLAMGHAGPCWCSNHSQVHTLSCSSSKTLEISHPSSPIDVDVVIGIPLATPETDLQTTLHSDETTASPGSESDTNFWDSDAESDTDPPSPSPSLSALSSTSDFEDLSNIPHPTTPSSPSSPGDEDWAIVSPSPQYLISSQLVTSSPVARYEYPISPVGGLLTPPLTPPHVAPDDAHSPWALTSVQTLSTPSPPSWAEEEWPVVEVDCVCDEKSAGEWPTLREAARTVRDRSGTRGGEGWDGGTDWFL